MATTKKPNSTKKLSTAKKSLSKKGIVRPRPLTWRFYVVAIGIFTISVLAMIVLALFASADMLRTAHQSRANEINSVYTSLSLDETYIVQSTNVFGDKRIYSTDKNRSQSSEKSYVHGDTVTNTVVDLDTKIKAAGFSLIDEPYPGSMQTHYHYKSAQGTYLRLMVTSKLYQDAYFNAEAMKQDGATAVEGIDPNAGPAKVIIKVNLDDNNE